MVNLSLIIPIIFSSDLDFCVLEKVLPFVYLILKSFLMMLNITITNIYYISQLKILFEITTKPLKLRYLSQKFKHPWFAQQKNIKFKQYIQKEKISTCRKKIIKLLENMHTMENSLQQT